MCEALITIVEPKPRPDLEPLNKLIDRYGGGIVVSKAERLRMVDLMYRYAENFHGYLVITPSGQIEIRPEPST